MKQNVKSTLEIDNVIHLIQKERGVSSLYVSSGTADKVDGLLHEAYAKTNDALNKLSNWISMSSPNYFRTKQEYQKHLSLYRNQTPSLLFEDVVELYNSDIAIFINWMVGVFEDRDSDVWAELVAYHMLINGKESVAIERALGTAFFTTGNLSQNTLLWYKGRHELAEIYLRQFGIYSEKGSHFFNTYVGPEMEEEIEDMRNIILVSGSNNAYINHSVEAGLRWFNNMTEYIDKLDEILIAMARYLTTIAEDDMQKHRVELVIDIVILLLAVVIVPLLTFFVYKITQKMEEIRKRLQEKTINLETEQKRTEALLSHLIPAKIAKRMHKNSLHPESYDCVTVMFSDICDFQMFVNKSTPDELIEMVNALFNVLDKRIAVYNVNKIGCIGNVAMVGSSMHQRHTDRHVEHVAALALDFQEKVQQITVSHLFGEKLKLRIGISTGTVVTGIVEGTFPRFCMYGEATANAEHMMITCLPQRIQITESTQKGLEKNSQFLVRERDDVIVKAADPSVCKTYWLVENSNTALKLDPALLNTTDS